ncbi:hypothetical protein DSECCO2_161280 [anaerobic digester metagenome]
MNSFKQIISKHHIIAFTIILLALLSVYGYIGLLNEPPQSTHLWRQSDCASIAQNYYQNGMNFFQPEIHNLHADGGTSGYATSECPYLYYTVAGLYKIFGNYPWVYRSVWTLIFIAGAIGLYLFALTLIGNKIASGALALIIISTPVITFYGNSYLPDVPALLFVVIGWALFFRWQVSQKRWQLYLTALFFLLGGLLKITAFMSLFALAGVWFLEIIGLRLGKNSGKVFQKPIRDALPFLVSFVVAVAWYAWAWKYNHEHQTSYFSMRTCPIWDFSECAGCSIADVIHQVKLMWLPHLYSKVAAGIFLAAFTYLLIFIKRANKLLLTLTAFTLLGTLAYMALWIGAFFDHDYYFINLYIFPIFLLITAFELAYRQHAKYTSTIIATVAIAGLTIATVDYTRRRQHTRYEGWMNQEHRQFYDFREFTSYAEPLGILPNDYIISLPDRTPNYTLNLINRKGWTLIYGQAGDSIGIQRRIALGARFLIVTNYSTTIEERPFIKPFTSNLIAEYNNLKVFRIDGQHHPKRLVQITDTLYHYFCNLEGITKRCLNHAKESSNFCQSANITDTIAHSGKHSIRLSASNPYGLTSSIEVMPGDIVTASVLKKDIGSKGVLALASKDYGDFFHSKAEGTIDTLSGWVKITHSLTISKEPEAKNLSIFVWNPGEGDAFFDDLTITITRNRVKIISTEDVSE